MKHETVTNPTCEVNKWLKTLQVAYWAELSMMRVLEMHCMFTALLNFSVSHTAFKLDSEYALDCIFITQKRLYLASVIYLFKGVYDR